MLVCRKTARTAAFTAFGLHIIIFFSFIVNKKIPVSSFDKNGIFLFNCAI
jgi:hypothetical protein